MKIGIMQPYLFPYLGYWQTIQAVDRYVVYDDVNYIKGGWINRNHVLINGAASLFTLGLSGAGSFRLINEVEVASFPANRAKLLKTFQNAYCKAPLFRDVFPMLEEIISYPELNLSRFLFHQLQAVCRYMGIGTELLLSSELPKDNSLKAEGKVIHICKLLAGSQYINTISGRELYDRERFRREGVVLNFIKMREIRYRQGKNEFVPNLSIIDVMMFNTPEECRNLLKEFDLQ